MSEIGALIVHLEAETAQFREDLGKVKGQLNDLGDSGGSAGRGISGGMYEARGSLMLIEESVGVRIPRHLNNLIATIPGVGAAFAMMLPIAGVAAAIMVVGELIKKQKEAQETAIKMGKDLADALINSQGLMENSDLTKMKLQDAINKLTGTVSPNNLKEAIIEAKEEAEKTAKSVSGIIQQLATAEAMGKGGFSAWLTGGENEKDLSGKLQWYGTQFSLAVAAGAKDGQKQALQGMLDATDAAIAAAQEHMKETKTRPQGDVMPVDEDQVKQIQAAIDHYKLVQAAIKNMQDAQKESGTVGDAAANAPIQNLIKQKGALEDIAEEINGHQIPMFSKAMQQFVASGSAAATEYMKKWTDAFDKQVQAGAKARKELNKLDGDGAEIGGELADKWLKEQEEDDKKAAEGQKITAEQMASVWEKETERNIQNYKDMVTQIDAAQAKMQASAEVKNAGLTGFGLDAAKASEARQQIAQIAQEMAQLDAEKKKLEADRDLVDPSDTANVNKYTQAINELIKKLGELEKQQAQATAAMKTQLQSWSTIQKNAASEATQAFNSSFTDWVIKGGSAYKMLTSFAEAWLRSVISGLLKDVEMKIMSEAEKTSVASAGAAAQTAVQSAADKKSQLSSAKAAASAAYKAMAGIPVIGPELGAVAAAVVFAGALAFEQGGVVPGSGSGDTVPAMLTPGETVVTKALTDRVSQSEGRGGNGDTHIHNHINATAMDAEGMDRVLTKHMTTITRHVNAQIRRTNKR